MKSKIWYCITTSRVIENENGMQDVEDVYNEWDWGSYDIAEAFEMAQEEASKDDSLKVLVNAIDEESNFCIESYEV